MESKPHNRPNPPGPNTGAWIDSSSQPAVQATKEQLAELEQLRQENTELKVLNAEKAALQAKEHEAFEAFERRLEADQKELEALKRKAQERGFIPYEERQQ